MEEGEGRLEGPLLKCNHCGQPYAEDASLLRCSGCDLVWYCGPEHQEYDWKKHKPLCRSVQAQRKEAERLKDQRRKRYADGAHVQPPPSVPVGGLPMELQGGPGLDALRVAPSYAALPIPIDSGPQGFISAAMSALAMQQQAAAAAQAQAQASRLAAEAAQAQRDADEAEKAQAQAKEAQAQALAQDSLKRARFMPAEDPTPTGLPPVEHIGGPKDHRANRPYDITVEQHLGSCLATCPSMTRYQAFCTRVQEISAHFLARLDEYGWAACDNFLGPVHADAILSEVKDLYGSQRFVDGQLMKATKRGALTTSTNTDIRSDFIYWFDNTTAQGEKAVNVNFLLSMIDSVVVQIGAGLKDCRVNGRSRAMVAVYPGNGSRYVKHVDNPVEDGRVVTTIYYLNKDWVPGDGGALRLFPTSAKETVDVQPVFDRLFMFWSDKRNPHEVLPVHNYRFAVTVWYFDESEKKRALERVAQREQRKLDRRAAKAQAQRDAVSASNGQWPPGDFHHQQLNTPFLPPPASSSQDQGPSGLQDSGGSKSSLI